MRTVGALLFCLGIAHAGDPIADHDKAHGRPELARIGTVGDRPPLDSTVIIHVHADGAIVLEDDPRGPRGRDPVLSDITEIVQRRQPKAILVRADARLPWGAIDSILVTCALGGARRVFHAVLPETGDEEGAFLWPVPRDWMIEPAAPWYVTVSDCEPPGLEPGALFWPVRDARPTEVVLDPRRDLPAHVVLRCADALCRAGAGSTRIARLSVLKGEHLSEPSELIRIFLRKPPRAGIALDFERTVSKQGGPMPPVERVRGAFAGWTADEAVPAGGAAGGGGPWARRTPGPDGRHGNGATAATEQAVALGLEWLARHQDPDGKWDCDGFAKHDPPEDKCDGAGAAPYDAGVTALALLAFLGAGSTGTDAKDPHAGTVRKGLDYLLAIHDEDDGVFGPKAGDRVFYGHVMATLAMCEAYGMTGDRKYKRPAQNGLNRIAMARNPGKAWRYAPRGGDNDTSVTAWCALANRAGEYAKLEVDPDSWADAAGWVADMTNEWGDVGYNERGGPPFRPKERWQWSPKRSRSMTAAGTMARILAGEPLDSRPIGRGVYLCTERPPKWAPGGDIDMYYWHWATLGAFHMGGRPRDLWNRALQEVIVPNQRAKGTGSRAGSWDPLDPWGAEGGRVYSTALLTLCLEAYYRYDFAAK